MVIYSYYNCKRCVYALAIRPYISFQPPLDSSLDSTAEIITCWMIEDGNPPLSYPILHMYYIARVA